MSESKKAFTAKAIQLIVAFAAMEFLVLAPRVGINLPALMIIFTTGICLERVITLKAEKFWVIDSTLAIIALLGLIALVIYQKE